MGIYWKHCDNLQCPFSSQKLTVSSLYIETIKCFLVFFFSFLLVIFKYFSNFANPVTRARGFDRVCVKWYLFTSFSSIVKYLLSQSIGSWTSHKLLQTWFSLIGKLNLYILIEKRPQTESVWNVFYMALYYGLPRARFSTWHLVFQMAGCGKICLIFKVAFFKNFPWFWRQFFFSISRIYHLTLKHRFWNYRCSKRGQMTFF